MASTPATQQLAGRRVKQSNAGGICGALAEIEQSSTDIMVALVRSWELCVDLLRNESVGDNTLTPSEALIRQNILAKLVSITDFIESRQRILDPDDRATFVLKQDRLLKLQQRGSTASAMVAKLTRYLERKEIL